MSRVLLGCLEALYMPEEILSCTMQSLVREILTLRSQESSPAKNPIKVGRGVVSVASLTPRQRLGVSSRGR
jgi:hypothetical protein